MKRLRINIAFIALLLLLPAALVCAQDLKRCAIGEVARPALLLRHQAMEEKIRQYVRLQAGATYDDQLIRIPVVVHIIHNNAAGVVGGTDNNNISDEQVFSQIRVLNEDYRREAGTPGFNTSPVGADMNIEFVLASTDPQGNPSSGIVRQYSPQVSFDVFKDNFALSALSYWDSNKYLNIWVTRIKDGYLGYGEFPGGDVNGLEEEDVDEKIDGVIIDYKAFGRKTGTAVNGIYKYGRTLTHEIGHWLGLLHTWGDAFCGDDFCADTPPTERGNLSDACTPLSSICRGTRTWNMIENFLDYTPDSCMNIFTQDQKARVRAILDISKRRRRLVINSQFSLPAVEAFDVKVLENPTTGTAFRVQVLIPDYSDFSYRLFNGLGQEVRHKTYTDYPSTVIEIPKGGLPPGVYNLVFFSGHQKISRRLIAW